MRPITWSRSFAQCILKYRFISRVPVLLSARTQGPASSSSVCLEIESLLPSGNGRRLRMCWISSIRFRDSPDRKSISGSRGMLCHHEQNIRHPVSRAQVRLMEGICGSEAVTKWPCFRYNNQIEPMLHNCREGGLAWYVLLSQLR